MYNPFLRVHVNAILQSMGFEADTKDPLTDEKRGQALAELRARKDKFKYKL